MNLAAVAASAFAAVMVVLIYVTAVAVLVYMTAVTALRTLINGSTKAAMVLSKHQNSCYIYIKSIIAALVLPFVNALKAVTVVKYVKNATAVTYIKATIAALNSYLSTFLKL